jgi:hypothetical protein
VDSHDGLLYILPKYVWRAPIFFVGAPGAIYKQTSSKAPAAPGIRSPAEAAGRFNRNLKSAGREANAPPVPQGLAFALLGLPCFLLASGRRRQKTGKQIAQKKQRKRFISPCCEDQATTEHPKYLFFSCFHCRLVFQVSTGVTTDLFARRSCRSFELQRQKNYRLKAKSSHKREMAT